MKPFYQTRLSDGRKIKMNREQYDTFYGFLQKFDDFKAIEAAGKINEAIGSLVEIGLSLRDVLKPEPHLELGGHLKG